MDCELISVLGMTTTSTRASTKPNTTAVWSMAVAISAWVSSPSCLTMVTIWFTKVVTLAMGGRITSMPALTCARLASGWLRRPMTEAVPVW